MKILQINTVYKTGSTGKIVNDIRKLISNDYESFVGYGRGEDYLDEKIIKIGQIGDMYLHGVGTRILDKHGLYSKKATIEFIKRIDKLKIDVFHLHNIHGYYLNYPIFFEYLRDKKVIWTLHDCWAYTGHCSYYDYIECNKWQVECTNCPQKKEYPQSLLLDNSRDNFRLKKHYFTSLQNLIIVTPSEWLAKEVKKSFLKNYRIEVINNGINLDIFKPVRSNFRNNNNLENKFLILGVANPWGKRKGFEYFIELAKKISKEEIIVMVGLTKKQIDNLPKNILGVEKTNDMKELTEIYTASDVFVNPTLEDNFPTTNLEANACGTPVITFNTGGSPECIDESTGIVVEKGNIDKLYEAILLVKKDGKDKFSKNCIERSKKFFDKSNNFSRYIELYND